MSTVPNSADMAMTLLASVPADATPTAAVGGILGRWVLGDMTLTASVTNPASVSIAVETAVGSGVYSTVMTLQAGIGLTAVNMFDYFFFVPTGRKYKFTKGGLGGTTETVNKHSYVEV